MMFQKNIDIFENDSKKFHSYFSVGLTVLSLIAIIILGLLFGQEIYLRQNPITNNKDVSTLIDSVNPLEFPIIYTVSVEGISKEDINKYVMVDKFDMNFTVDYSYTQTSDFDKECDSSKISNPKLKSTFETEYERIKKFSESSSSLICFCANSNLASLSGRFATSGSVTHEIRFFLCYGEESCKNFPSLNDTYRDFITYGITYFSAVVDITNYEDPINLK